MEVKSIYRGARMSAFKVRELTREIQGLPASAALDVIAFSSKKAALFVGKTLKSAIANAENNNELRVESLVVKEATAGEGQTMKRIKSRARGSASTIRKRTSHIRIILSDEIEIPTRNCSTKKAAGAKGKRPAAAIGAKSPAASKPAETPAASEEEKGESGVKAEPASQKNEGPGETASAPKESADDDTTKF